MPSPRKKQKPSSCDNYIRVRIIKMKTVGNTIFVTFIPETLGVPPENLPEEATRFISFNTPSKPKE